jgi:archaellum component FlaG (FlaF/FlaG flagellin family)
MYELEYVRKRKRKKRAIIIAGIATIGLTSLCITAFLGRYVGTFTVSLESKDVDLTLSEKSSFVDKSSYLRVNAVPVFQEFTYGDFRKIGDDVIDSEETDYTLGANPNQDSLNFLKYTFFIKNVGMSPAKYDFSLRIKENVASTDGRSLDDTLRVMVYNNGTPTVYAKRLSVPHNDEQGNPGDYRAPKSVDLSQATEEYPFEGYAEMFASTEEIMNEKDDKAITLQPGEFRRYTIVTWLEGFRSSNTQNAPKGATIKLGVEINAYENE